MYSIDDYKEAFSFALQAHKTQQTPNGLPYSFHIVSVANEIINSLFFHKISYEEANIAIACALLHDVEEDTPYKVDKHLLVLDNIDVISKGVKALTKDTNLPKQEQLKDSLERLKQQPCCVQMVKLADRITNLDPAPLFWNRAKREAYVKEAKMILEYLKNSNLYLADKLKNKIDSYKIEYNDDYLVFFVSDKRYIVLDKSKKEYLQTFKTLNRLGEYVCQQYGVELFVKDLSGRVFKNISKNVLKNYKNSVGMKYVVTKLNEKELLNIDKQIDTKIEKYITFLYNCGMIK